MPELCRGAGEGIRNARFDERQDTGDGFFGWRLGFPASAFWVSMRNCATGEMGGMCFVLIAIRSPLCESSVPSSTACSCVRLYSDGRMYRLACAGLMISHCDMSLHPFVRMGTGCTAPRLNTQPVCA